MGIQEMGKLTAAEVRDIIRAGDWVRPTAGMASGFIQANLVILPSRDAEDFYRFCKANPKPCPLLEMTEPGSPEPRRVAPGADIRRDLPRYRIFKDGVMTEEVEDIAPFWREDMVSFLLGCSYTFEHRLARAGIPMRHWEKGCNIAAYITDIECEPAGVFRGPMVVSMRPVKEEQVELAIRVTEPHHHSHGAPVHTGRPEDIGINELSRPDYGDPVELREGEVPVFWACGVTPQAVLLNARPPLAITHSPGYMFITDLRDDQPVDLFGAP
jgi:uncharacterized protein YcsI (UPF0317 family)